MTTCTACHRPLTTEKSRRLGMGAVCAAKRSANEICDWMKHNLGEPK